MNAVCDQETSKIQPRNQETTRRPRRERHDISSAPRGHQETTNAPRKHWLSTGAPEDHEEETTKRPPRDEQETSRRPPRHPAENSDILRRPSGHHPESLPSPQILAHFGMWDLEGHPESFPPNASAIQIFREPEVVCRIIHKPHSSSFLGSYVESYKVVQRGLWVSTMNPGPWVRAASSANNRMPTKSTHKVAMRMSDAPCGNMRPGSYKIP